MNKIIQTLTLMMIAAPAFAGIEVPVQEIPEPGTLALFGLGAVVALAFAIKRK